MLWFAKCIIALVCYSVLFVPIPDVEARRKRKCPSSCLRKIREIEKVSLKMRQNNSTVFVVDVIIRRVKRVCILLVMYTEFEISN